MPNRYVRNADNILVPKIPIEGIDKESVKVLPAYSYTDDFGYSSSPTGEYTVTGTWSGVPSGSKFASGTTAGNSGGILKLGTGNNIDPTKKVVFRCRASLNDDDEELFAYIGLGQTEPTNADPPVEADDFIGFTLVETTANANWQCTTATDLGTTETDIDTGVAVGLSVHDFEFVLENGLATFKIDGNIVGSTTATLPTNTALVPRIKVTTGDTTAKGITVDVLSIQNDRV